MTSRHLLICLAAAFFGAAAAALHAVQGDPAPAAPFDSSKVTVPLEDRIAIYDLFARYSQALDMGNSDEMVNNVFAPNGVFHDPGICLVGGAEIRARLTSHPSRVKTSQHWVNNIVITAFSGDRAKTHSYVLMVGPGRGVTSVGTLHDTLIKVRGRWLIEDREVWRPGEIKLDPRCPTDLSAVEP